MRTYDVDDSIFSDLPPDGEQENPYLRGAFRPQSKEFTAGGDKLQVIGEIPDDLAGIYVRNTHNQVMSPRGIYHPFDGDGMLHAVHFEDGDVTYRNRFVRTTGFFAEQGARRALWPGIMQPGEYTRRGWGSMGVMKDNAGTDVIAHAGRLLAAMSQGSEPWILDPRTLETLGVNGNWARAVRDGIASHYKVDSETGEMIFFNYPEKPPYMNYGVIDRNDQLVHYVPIDLPGARWPHDIGMTKHYTVLHDLPYFFDTQALKSGRRKLEFHRDVPARFGIIPRFGNSDDVRWFEASPCWIMHLSNCYEDGDWVVQDGCIWDHPVKPPLNATDDPYVKIRRNLDKHATHTHMYRWMFNLKSGEVREQNLDDEVTEFPIVSNDYVGLKNRYSYNSLFVENEWLMAGIKRYDWQTDTAERFEYGPGRFGSEVAVARRQGATAEDDGYVVSFVTDLQDDCSEAVILRADDLASGPIARVVLPERISVGVHGCWVEGDRIDSENRDVSMLPLDEQDWSRAGDAEYAATLA